MYNTESFKLFKKVKKFDCFIFDFDGTLVDSRLNIANSFNYALKINKFKQISPKLIYPLIGKLTIEETFKKFYPQLSQYEIETLVKSFRNYQKIHAIDEIIFFDGVIETIKKLRNNKKQIAIVTTKNINQLKHILKVFKIDNLFDVVFGSGINNFKKPQKECLDYITKNLKSPIQKNKILMIGDSIIDCEFANNCQIDIAAVSWGIDSVDILKKAGAKYIINRISELINFV